MRAAFLEAVEAATERVARSSARADSTFPHAPQWRTVLDRRRGVVPLSQSDARARFLTVAEVAELLRVSNMTVYRLIKAGDLRRGAGREVVPDTRGRRRPLPRQPLHAGRLTALARTTGSVAARCRGSTPSPSSPTTALADEFVGVVKSVIRTIAPARGGHRHHPRHPAPRRRGPAASRSRAAPSTCRPGVVLAVVDPGVAPPGGRSPSRSATSRRRCSSGPTTACWRRPSAWSAGAGRAVSLTNADYQLAAPGPTFAGRDVFAPAAAHLCAGVDLAELGELIDAGTLQPGLLPLTRHEDAAVDGRGAVDRPLRQRPAQRRSRRGRPRSATSSRCASASRCGRRVRAAAFAELDAGQLGLVVDSYGLLALALDRRSAAEELRLHPGDAVTLEAAR